jgi:site-specific DNA recombinase
MGQKATVAKTSSVQQASTSQPSHVEQSSWEYLMPKRKERMAGYIYDIAVHEYREAISAYMVPYLERPKSLKLLEAAKRREFDVLVVSEVRAISRRQVEVFIIYDLLQKYGIRLETIKEKFEDDAMGRLILSSRAAYAEIEREQSHVRMQRGKKDRIEIGKAPNGHSKAAYGYILVDTQAEVKGAYEFNHVIIYVDEDGVEWSEYKVCVAIFDWLKEGMSLHGVVNRLNDLGIPPPKKARKGEAHWTASTLQRIIKNRIYVGEVWANRFKKVVNEKTKKATIVERPKEEWIRLPDAPALTDKETFEAIQKQLAYNKNDSLRNTNPDHKDALGLLRAGYIFCGVCGRRMHIIYTGGTPRYFCRQKSGSKQSIVLSHRTQIRIPSIDTVAKEKIAEALQNSSLVRARVEELRIANKPVINAEDIEATIEHIKRSMQNLFTLAQNATTDDTMAELTQRMNDLEQQKREAEGMLFDLEDDEEELAELEAELTKFEKWADEVRPFLTDPEYLSLAPYEELRLAVRILGIHVTIYPTIGDWPCRYQIDVTVPEVMKKVYAVSNHPRLVTFPW